MMLRPTLLVALAAILAACGSKPTTKENAKTTTAPLGTAPALPPGFPPLPPGATLEGVNSNSSASGWERVYLYTGSGKADEIVAFYRTAMPKSGMQVVAEGGGPYGAILRAQSADKKRLVTVDIDAPEDKPNEAPKITLTILDSR